MLKRLTSGVLAIVLLICMLPQLNFKTAHAAYYPEGWETWGQWQEPWGSIIMSPGSDTIGQSGCWVSSYAKAYIQAGLVPDDMTDYDLGTFMKWASAHNVLDTRSCITGPGFTMLQCWPDGDTSNPALVLGSDPENSNLVWGDPKRISVEGWSREKIVERLTKLRNEGKMIILRLHNNGHSVLVGDPFINDNGVADIELLDSGWSNGCRAIMSNNEKVGQINFYTILERADGKPVYPGTVFEDSAAQAKLDSAVQNSAEENSPLYRISKYNEEQKESLALLQNKSMDSYEIAAWKWNMIVSQFSIPYVNSLSETLTGESWVKIYKSVQDAEFEENPYLESGTVEVSEDFKEAAQQYLQYLKDNSGKLNEVLRLLANEDNNVYSPLWSSEKTSATVEDLLYGDVLYLRDNITLTGSAVQTEQVSEEDTDVTIENQVGSDGEIQDTEEDANSVVNEPLALWAGLESMYDISTDEARTAYKSILEKSAIETVSIPVFTATDATMLYNTLFISNAMELYGDTYGEAVSTVPFVENYKDKLLFMDRWGNICINDNDKYVIVYPSYANPLFVSTELENTDLAGVYYEALNEQLTKYNLSLSTGDTVGFLMTNDDKVQITVEDAIKHINNFEPESNDIYVGEGEGSFRIGTAIDNEGNDTSTIEYNRITTAVDLSKKSAPFYRFDTTTLAFANKTLLTMMTRSDFAASTRNWYNELKDPNFKGTLDPMELGPFVLSNYSNEGKLTVERFGTHMGLYATRASATSSKVSVEGSIYSVINGGNIVLLSKWREKGNVIEPYYVSSTKTLESSGAVLGYATTLGNFSGTDLAVSPAEYPFMNYYNGIKSVYDSEYNTGSVRGTEHILAQSLKGKGEVSSTYLYESTYDVRTDKQYANITMYENLYALEYLDSERFNLYFTTNTDLASELNILTNKKKYTCATAGTYVNDIVNSSLATGVNKAITQPNTNRRRLVSIPILATAVDDASSWGIWNGQSGNIDKYRSIDTSLSTSNGILRPTVKETTDFQGGLDYTSTGLKYLLANEVVSPMLVNPPIEDIISIAYIWDTYYIPNSPICTKLDAKDVKVGTSIYKENTVLTPYNAIHEANNNTLFWTRETNGSIDMEILNTNTLTGLTSSSYKVHRDIYQVSINYPTFVLAVNKNGYGENLVRWVEDLEDPASTSTYIMDLISAFLKHPISGMKNFFLGLIQYLHGMISKGSLGSVFNIESIFNLIWNNTGTKTFIILYCIFISIGLVVVSLRYMVMRLQKGLLRKLGRVVAIGFIPIILIAQVGPLFNWVTNKALTPVINKIVLTELEGAQRGQSKIQLGGDDSVLLDNLLYNQETFADLTVDFLTDIDQFGNPVYTEVCLSDLYQSVSYNSWIGQAEYLAVEKEFNGFAVDTSKAWYNTEEFVPVHYTKYKDSVFYYFYDWIKSSYIRYYAKTGSNVLTGYQRPTDGEDLAYIFNVSGAEETYMDYAEGMYTMYTDEAYVRVENGYSDIFGLSNLFKMTNEYGLPLSTYSSDITIEDWADTEYLEGISRLANFEAYKQNATDSVTASPIAAIIASPYWEQYKDSVYLQGEDTNDMTEYNFTPDYIQAQYNGTNTVDFMSGWQSKGYLIQSTTNERTPWRVYGSEALLAKDTGNVTTKDSVPTGLESKLFQLNQNIYEQVLNLCEVYKEGHITDDTMIFTFALLATFEFNSVFGGDTTSLNLETISTDKLFRVIYATEIEDVIDNPNLIYMIYERGGLLTAVIFFLTEVLFVVTMYIRCVIYLLLILACIVTCFSEFFLAEEKLAQMLKGVLIQIGILLIGQVIVIVLLRIGLGTLSGIDGKGMLFMVTLLYGIVCLAVCKWHWAMLKSLLKSLRTFGYGVMRGELVGLTTIVNNAKIAVTRARVNKVSGVGLRYDKSKYGTRDVVDDAADVRRSINAMKLEDDGEESEEIIEISEDTEQSDNDAN